MSAKETEAKEVKGIKMEEVEKHSSIDDLWLVIDGASRGPFPAEIKISQSRRFVRSPLRPHPARFAGKVYDVTPFMDDHPGGGEIGWAPRVRTARMISRTSGSPCARDGRGSITLDESSFGGVGSGVNAKATKAAEGEKSMSILAILAPSSSSSWRGAAKHLTAVEGARSETRSADDV